MWIAPNDPQRPPDWRWQNILYLENHWKRSVHAEDVRRSLLADTPFTIAFKARHEMLIDHDSLQKSSQSGTSHVSKICSADIQLVIDAERLAVQNAGHADYWLHESLVLGRTPIDIMSLVTGVSPDLMKTLDPIFFDVHSRLDDGRFMWNQVIRTDPRTGLRDTVEELWLECAYLGGYERMLYLRAGGKKKDLYCSNRDLQLVRPVMSDYLVPGKASSDVLHVIETRMESDPTRTIRDLQNLYLTLPGGAHQTLSKPGTWQQPKAEPVARTSFVITDAQTGQRQRRTAEVLV